MHMSKTQATLPETLNAESLNRGEGYIPDSLTKIFTVLYLGSDQSPKQAKTQRLIQSISEDAIYSTTLGRTKSGKHLNLVLSLKCMIRSRKVIEILNRLGHCVGYHIVEEIETDLATQIM